MTSCNYGNGGCLSLTRAGRETTLADRGESSRWVPPVALDFAEQRQSGYPCVLANEPWSLPHSIMDILRD